MRWCLQVAVAGEQQPERNDFVVVGEFDDVAVSDWECFFFVRKCGVVVLWDASVLL